MLQYAKYAMDTEKFVKLQTWKVQVSQKRSYLQ